MMALPIVLFGIGDVMAVGIANPRAAQADGFHRAFHALDLDAVADVKRLVQKNRHRAEQIRHRVLRRQAERQAADGQAGEQDLILMSRLSAVSTAAAMTMAVLATLLMQRQQLLGERLVLRRDDFFAPHAQQQIHHLQRTYVTEHATTTMKPRER